MNDITFWHWTYYHFDQTEGHIMRSIDQKVLYWLGLIALYPMLVLATYSIVTTARDSAAGGDEEGMRLSDNRPPIQNCPADVELWDCIRHAEYARE